MKEAQVNEQIKARSARKARGNVKKITNTSRNNGQLLGT
jgi:hypothetical protein